MSLIYLGREQVFVGIVPIIGNHGRGIQSALSVYPLAIANCSEISYWLP